ncbi:kptA, partial [Symbiodinium microadriaticum]
VTRLDRAAIIAHFKATGPRGTFLANTCKKTLPDNSTGVLCYIFPKYTLSHAQNRHVDMSCAMCLALAENNEDVCRACADAATGEYDVFRHMHLRRAYVSLFVREDKQVVDLHKDFVAGGGFSEHAEFLKSHMTVNGFLEPMPKGPKNSQAAPKTKKQPKSKQSDKLKRMLRPPGSDSLECVSAKPKAGVKLSKEVAEFLPGMRAGKDMPAGLHAVVANDDDDHRCLAPLSKGGRCRRKRAVGNFCKQHHLEHASEEKKKTSWEQLEGRWKQALLQWDDVQLHLAATLSLEEDAERARKNKLSLDKVSARLKDMGRQRVDTPAEGDCQFIAVIYSGCACICKFQPNPSPPAP